jgi:transcriptional regulator with XRE-family HTH domain
MEKNNEIYHDQEIGRKLKELRTEKKLSMRTVGEKLGINYTYISKIENGYIPSVKLLKDICEIYDIELKDLFGESKPVPKELREIGVEWITFAKEMQEQELTPDKIKEYIDIIKRFKDV